MGSWLPWRKLASNPPGLDWPALPWQSRGLYALLLGLANDAGRIPLGRLGLPSLAGGINAPWSEVHPHFDALVSAGWLEVEGSDVFLPHFADSQRAATTAERVAEFRKRMRNDAVTDEKRPSNDSLPDRNESVTNRELDKKEIRLDQNRKDSLVISEPKQPELELVPQQAADANQKPKEPSKAQIQAQVALGLFAELVAARMSVIAGAEQLQPRPAALAGIKACLGQGYTPDQIRHVIKLKAAEVRAYPGQARWFVPKWFHPANVEQYYALSEADVTSVKGGRRPSKSPADIKREAELDAYFARQDRKHDAIDVASTETRREF
uniref:Uncharacterized protein n=1 Tax=uncultured bacterium A1Q1_fos_25 TaxID=1256569 RepID=L7VX46_9BACT|nr:hypothetical protein [uncultured bacterium A1Q1_fos_25]